MKSGKFLAALLSAAICLNGSSAGFRRVNAADYVREKSRVSVHDPSIIKDPASGMYYVFGSHIDAAKSADLQSWRLFTNGYRKTNNTIFGDLSGNLKGAFAWAGEDLEDCAGGFAVWAPDVFWNADYVNPDGSKGAYLMYFCTSSTYMRSVIAFAASKTIEGPYTFADNLIYSGFTDNDSFATSATKNVNRKYTSTNIDELITAGQVTYNNSWFNQHGYNNQQYPNAIDPTIYTDPDGRMYMCYGSWSGGIFTLEIDKQTGRCIHPKTGQTADGRMVDSYFGTKISGGWGKSGEGPFIEYNADTGFYYLFVTYGGLTSSGGYNMRVGRSRSPLGPFVDAAGRNMVLEKSTQLDSIGLKLMTNYQIPALARAYMACGHNSVLHDDNGQWYLINHARFDDGSEYHEVRVHAMLFNADGWPVVMPYEYSGETWSENGYEPTSLAGTYAFLNHGTATDGKITKSQEITLSADGSISGAVNGTWSIAEHSALAKFTIGNAEYLGRFSVQYDESGTGKQVMTFTAAGSSNQTIWGVQTAAWSGSERTPQHDFTGEIPLCTDKFAVADPSGSIYLGDSGLLSNVTYQIRNRNSGLLLDTDPDTGGMRQWEYRADTAAGQTFRLTDLGGGYCRITPLSDETKCVTVQGSTAENGLDVSIAPFTGADNQQFRLVRSGMHYGIVSKCSGDQAGLDVYEWSTKNGGVVKQWEFWDGGCQLWDIEPAYAYVPDRSYTLRNAENGAFLNSADGKLTETETPAAWNLQRTDAGNYAFSDGAGMQQTFAVICNADGSYSFESAENNALSGQRYVLAPAEPVVVQPQTTETTPPETTSAPKKLLLGDTDCCGSVDVSDAVLLARILTEDKSAVVSDQGMLNSDCNRNGTPDSDDITLILMHIARISKLPETEN